MSDADDDPSLEELQCDQLAASNGARVAILRSIRANFDALSDQQRGRFKRIMELWCNRTPLAPNMFNPNEGRAKQSNVLIQAFKAFKIRLYGFERPVGGSRTFLIIDFDPAKKQDKADPTILKRAKRDADEIVKDINNGQDRRK